jgi:hypothetical protein
MSYSLRQASFVRLKAQMNLTGRFTHSLFDRSTGSTVLATIDTERGTDKVQIVIRMATTHNSIALPLDAKSNADRVANHLEAIANGYLDTADAALSRHPVHAAA